MKIIIYSTLFLFFTISVYPQETPYFSKPIPGDKLFAAPSVSALLTREFLPVNLYTGRVNIEIPFYEIQIGNIKIPISITYNSSGLKVDEISSNVGLGWSLNAGGNITRVVKGIEDGEMRITGYNVPDDTGDNAGNYEKLIQAMGYHRKNTPFQFNNRTYLGFTELSEGNHDSSPDIFRLIAPGFSDSFYLKDTQENNTITPFENRFYTPVFINNSGVVGNINSRTLIEHNPIGFSGTEDGNPYQSYPSYTGFSLFDFNNFLFKNINGLVYEFDKKDIVETYITPVFDMENMFTNYSKTITSWHLKSIKDSSTNRTVTFSYEEFIKSTSEKSLNYKGTSAPPGGFGGNSIDYIHAQYNETRNQFIHSNEILTKYPKLNRITEINWDGGKIEFKYEQNRQDYIGDKVLTKILVKDFNGNIIKTILFEQSYYPSKENCSEDICKRLKLDKVKIVGTEGIEHSYILNYDLSNSLPKRTSLQRDYLGYFNNNGVAYFSNNYEVKGPSPMLYFYPNQGKYSIIPFQRNDNSNYRIISGYSLLPNDYALSGMLTKIIYPTGGWSEFEYETHKFNLYGYDYIAGGARIKKQILNDGIGNENIFEYDYREVNGNSSGSINNIPTFGYPNTNTISLNASGTLWDQYFTTFDKCSSGIELTDGSYVGYSRIIEKQLGNGHTEYIYNSPKDYPNEDANITFSSTELNFLLNNSSFPALPFVDNDNRRGNLVWKRIYTKDSDLKWEQHFFYTYSLFESKPLFLFSSIPYSLFNQGGPAFNQYWLEANTSLNIERNLQTKVVTNEYENGMKVTKEQSFIYDSELPFVKESSSTNSLGGILKNTYKYVFDYEPTTSSVFQKLYDENRLSELITFYKYQNSTLIENNEMSFKNDIYTGLTLPEKTLNAKGTNNLVPSMHYEKYTSNGNVKEYRTENDIPTVIIWGYKQMYPVAKIENATYSQIEGLSYFGVGFDLGLAGLSSNQENSLRSNLTNAMITTYTYKPLIGLTSETDPKGYTIYYEYDDFNRLEYIRDAEGKILSKHEYHYKGQ